MTPDAPKNESGHLYDNDGRNHSSKYGLNTYINFAFIGLAVSEKLFENVNGRTPARVQSFLRVNLRLR